ncbi:glutamyl-tRNA reductase [Polycyclovorans algicola]|uniref:glutamyl-tRNA reductase n=1 Tax=Polycyclovorans algicola TaxID=616992 RepID=UPI0004A6F4DB|nr:glutamyl-tRNA reductase [Polycyclovorans algicola]
MTLITLGLSHHSTPIELRERMAFAEADLVDALARLRALPGVAEAAILSTCNRTELMTVGRAVDEAALVAWWQADRRVVALDAQHVYCHHERSSVEHTLAVASGLDSMVLGEPQILGQMKQSFAIANEAESLGPVLSRLFQHAFSVAKQVRSETDIGAHPVSVAYASVQMARRIYEDLTQQTALLVGAGEMITLVGRYLQQQGVRQITVANRSLERAEALAADLGGRAISLAQLDDALPGADLVVSSTAAREAVISFDAMRKALRQRRRKPVFMIDLAVPRDIEPRIGKLADVYLYTIDDLRHVVAENMKLREGAAVEARTLIAGQADVFMRWLDARDAGDTLRALRHQAARQRDEVLDKARRRLVNGEAPEAVMQFLADTLTNKLLHAPVSRLGQADRVEQGVLLEATRRLFGLDGSVPGDDDHER